MDRTQVLGAIRKLRQTAIDLRHDIDMLAMATGNDEADKELQDAYIAMYTITRHLRNAYQTIENQ